MRSSKPKRKRRGASSVEFALTAPLVFLFLFSAIEFGRIHMVQHTMQNAVYEGARRGLVPKATDDQILVATMEVLDAVGVKEPKVTVFQTQSQVTVNVVANFDQQSWLVPLYFIHKDLTSTITLTKDAG